MAKAKIEKTDVAAAIEALKKDGRNPTIAGIRAALCNQGSLTTIQQFKKELDEEEISTRDSPEALANFRSIWAAAIVEGRSQRNEELGDLVETAEALSVEVRKLEGENSSFRSSSLESATKYQESQNSLMALARDLSGARQASEENARKLIEVLEIHRQREKDLEDQLLRVQARAHELELQLVRVETRLESVVTPGRK